MALNFYQPSTTLPKTEKDKPCNSPLKISVLKFINVPYCSYCLVTRFGYGYKAVFINVL